MGMFSLLASAPLEKYSMGFVGARVAVESEKTETFLDNVFENSLEETFFFFGSVVVVEETAEEEDVDMGFGSFEEGFTRRGIDDAVVGADGIRRLVIAGRGLVGDIIMSLMKVLVMNIKCFNL